MRAQDRIGEVKGNYTIIGVENYKDSQGQTLYKCKCNTCGTIRICRYFDIKPNNRDCTHYVYLGSIKYPIGRIQARSLQHVFNKVCNRCYCATSKDYRWYGAKGITVCDEWLNDPEKFEQWALTHGYIKGLTLDRICPDKKYCPENCRWISRAENTRRAGKVNWITVNNETLTGHQWADKLGIGTNSINNYMHIYGISTVEKLIQCILDNPEKLLELKPNQSYLDLYDIK